jgi:hypothetical protein
MKRVVITPEAFNSLLWGCGVCVLIGLFFFAFAMATAIGAVGLIGADFELDSGQIGFMGRKVNDVFFPAKVCVSDITLHTYATLILLLWVPSCILASLVWPAWLVSLLLGTVLANDDVEDLMKDLTPANVKKFMSPPMPKHDDDTEKDAEARKKKILQKAERYWQVNAALPGALLVVTMDQLTCWGTAMGHALVCCVVFSLGLVPTAVASHSLTMTVIVVCVAAVPILMLWQPATVSSACDDLLDQLNDISFLGNVLHKDRCTHLSVRNTVRNTC